MNLADIKQLYNEGNKVAGRKALIGYLKSNPTDDSAWAYLGAKCTNLGERKFCYEKALEIADNPTIRARLDKLADYDSAKPPEFLAVPAKKNRLPIIVGSTLGLGLFCAVCLCVGTLSLFPPEPRHMVVAPTATPAAIIASTDTPVPTELTPPTPTATTTPDGSDLMAKVKCEQYVTEHLKVPDSADFGGMFDQRQKVVLITPDEIKQRYPKFTLKNPKGVWMVTGYVDSLNLFNVRLTSDYVCLLDFDWHEDTWRVVDFSLKAR